MTAFKDRTGENRVNNEGCKFKIIEYFGSRNITIQFQDGTIIYNKNYGAIKLGNVVNPNFKSVFNIGFIGIGKYSYKEHFKIYVTWQSMLRRCYDAKYHLRQPTYKNCSVDEKWHNFQVFAEWYVNNYINDYHLDKDILFKGNKVYGPNTCCFVPQEINALFIKHQNARGKYPIGVIKKGNKYEARVNKNGYRESQGLFDTSEEAFEAYKIAKEEYIKEVADSWREQITEQTYQAMYAYEVEITD